MHQKCLFLGFAVVGVQSNTTPSLPHWECEVTKQLNTAPAPPELQLRRLACSLWDLSSLVAGLRALLKQLHKDALYNLLVLKNTWHI